MPKPPLLSLLCSLSLFSAPLAAGELQPKQLAGPPEDFAQMRAPDPAESAILSKSALLPVELAPAGQSARWQGSLPVENGHLRFMVLSGDQVWDAAVAAPAVAGARTAAVATPLQAQRTLLGSAENGTSGMRYAVESAPNGNWSLTLQSASPVAQRGYVLMEGDERTQLASYLRNRQQQVGQSLTLNALLSGNDASGATLLAAQAGKIDEASLRVIDPQGGIRNLPMADDGKHDDGAAGDGVYGGTFQPTSEGTWIAQVIVRGHDQAGQAFVRTSEHVLPVLDTSLRLLGNALSARAAEGTRLTIALPVAARGKAPSHYRVFGQVWGTDAKGKDLPVAWIGGMLTPQQGQLPLSLDERWIARAGARAPFTLRSLRIEDPDHYIPLVQAGTLPLQVPALRRVSIARASTAIDESMRMGPRPSALASAMATAQPQAAGSQLVLVHGYCSNGVWPQAQFTNASTFLDPKQNRSNDQFAQLLAQFASQWSSFSTVAHSQGGMAALHLYTYYWSGLDKATGGRVMQSVGTPYQGTNMAGVLATAGSRFGEGCGSNTDMTYDGAKAWLAGIPPDARAKVNYYTTSFAKSKKWYTNDYCNAASDLVLKDPEDGVVEEVNAQLPGGVNLGHTTGQCHTTGMRDPAQYLDADRNAVMNANAAR
ncbi:choice-of-anchor X domain-containing protein [Xanthomonas vasicola]|uniref:Conditioned medium factor n=1 Tax=Xanthomonas vasicola pv. vasculorum NCPPB 890 TaxID=1184265 RepID=A0A836P5Q8_XANVA|nr:choice-of-anchor X domain-containing protein [Xanthomonas vasicola]KFA38817.1 conditioned medium factor [Xanthomonas vasicola pv. musacearum NCPPB 4384]AZR25414.1 conditioned medium factor [Xanthomonas vasicola pv. arecae]AZR29432.1 conditioned medium factor [Xanthomonas vasicola pv. musacearum NCPPB 4379]KEZ98744.1 conditioned medium factor [Xanthomonas vasicola pv. vasculorum NCPPB 895]KFA05973.1 conditioned medium factor [Xanthomonas vasicola pv. musacearum NCPPB 2005]